MPKLVTVLREGYGAATLRPDVLAGLQIAVVAPPLATALAIAGGAEPERGVWTAIVAGFPISTLGGSRFQIGGPTGAFVVVFGVLQRFGHDGLVPTFLPTVLVDLTFAVQADVVLAAILDGPPRWRGRGRRRFSWRS